MRSWNSGSRADDRLIHATQTAREKSITIIRIALVHDPSTRPLSETRVTARYLGSPLPTPSSSRERRNQRLPIRLTARAFLLHPCAISPTPLAHKSLS